MTSYELLVQKFEEIDDELTEHEKPMYRYSWDNRCRNPHEDIEWENKRRQLNMQWNSMYELLQEKKQFWNTFKLG